MTRRVWRNGGGGWGGAVVGAVAIGLAGCAPAPGQPGAVPPAAGGASTAPASARPSEPRAAKPAPGAAATAAPAIAIPPVPETLTFAYTSFAANQWAYFAAEERGYFEQQGIHVDWQQTGAAAAGVQMLASGSVDVNDANPDPAIRAISNGADIVLLAGTLNPAIYTLFTQRDVTSVEGLRGKTVILGGPKDITLYIFDRMVQPHGLRRDDYDTVYAGSTPDRLRALQAGAVQGTILSYPVAFAAAREGFTPLLDSYDTVRNLPFSTVAVTRAWLGQEAHRQQIVRFLTAAYRGAQDACAPANKELMIRLLAEKTRLTDEDARLTYVQVMEDKRTYKCDLTITPDELQTVVDYIVAMGDFPAPGPDPRRIVDLSYRDQAVSRAAH